VSCHHVTRRVCVPVYSRLKRESGTNLDAEQLLQQKEHEVRSPVALSQSR